MIAKTETQAVTEATRLDTMQANRSQIRLLI